MTRMGIMLGALLVSAASASAQSVKQVVLDPTTYAPAVVKYLSAKGDWDTSQQFFQHGWLEANPIFTADGKRDSKPMSYSRGMRRIQGDSLTVLGMSAAHNVLSETLLQNHPRWGRVERIAANAYLSYRVSHRHLEQISINRRIARAGIKDWN